MARGPASTGVRGPVVNEPAPSPKRTDTSYEIPTTRSRKPSPLMSPAARALGRSPTSTIEGGSKGERAAEASRAATVNTTERSSTRWKRPIPTPVCPVTYRVEGEETTGKCRLSKRGREQRDSVGGILSDGRGETGGHTY